VNLERPVFVDTNILLYARDTHYSAKRAVAQNWVQFLARRQLGRLSAQVLLEFYSAATDGAKLGIVANEARSDVEALAHWDPVPSDLALWRTAWRLADSHSLSWRDSMIMAAAVGARCGTPLSEDLQDGLVVDGTLTVMNPFAPQAPPPPDGP
jgi:predicted nucleic acid-binding protein